MIVVLILQFAGMDAVNLYSINIYQHVGYDTSTARLWTTINGITNLAFAAVPILLIKTQREYC